MELEQLIIYGIAAFNSVALLAFTKIQLDVSRKLEVLADNDKRMEQQVHLLDKRVTRIETVNDERLKLIDEIHTNLKDLSKDVRDMRAAYDKDLKDFFEKYQLTKK